MNLPNQIHVLCPYCGKLITLDDLRERDTFSLVRCIDHCQDGCWGRFMVELNVEINKKTYSIDGANPYLKKEKEATDESKTE